MACVLSMLFFLPFAASSDIAFADAAAPSGNRVAQAVEVDGEAIFAATPDKLIEFERARRYEKRTPSPAFRLAQGQWLRAGDAVMALENTSILLRWRDGSEERIGGRAIPAWTRVRPPLAPRPAARVATASTATPPSFGRTHRPALLFALGAILALLPLARRATHAPGTIARVCAALLLVGVTLPVSLLLGAAQLGRMAWYQPPTPGIAWSGAAATFAHVANLAAFALVSAGSFALVVLGVALARGGDALARRAGAWWWLAFATVAIGATAFLAPHAPQLDYESAWYAFWHGWARYYAIGAWLLLPFAQILACAPTRAGMRHPRRNGAAAGALLMVFAGCVATGYGADYDPSTGTLASQPASRADARRWLCASTHVFEGTTGEPRIVRAADCGTAEPASADADRVLAACETAVVSVRIDAVLRSPDLQPGQTVDFAVAHARERLDGESGLLQALRQRRLLFLTRDTTIDGRPAQVSAAHPGRNRSAPLGFAAIGDGAYARGVIAECAR